MGEILLGLRNYGIVSTVELFRQKPPSSDLCLSFYIEQGTALELPTPIFFDVRIHEILSIDQNSMSFAAKLQIVGAWFDDRMRWLPQLLMPMREGNQNCRHICGQVNDRWR